MYSQEEDDLIYINLLFSTNVDAIFTAVSEAA
jgi:hypothetical protein